MKSTIHLLFYFLQNPSKYAVVLFWLFYLFFAFSIILYFSNTIQYNTIQYNTIQYNTIQYNII